MTEEEKYAWIVLSPVYMPLASPSTVVIAQECGCECWISDAMITALAGEEVENIHPGHTPRTICLPHMLIKSPEALKAAAKQVLPSIAKDMETFLSEEDFAEIKEMVGESWPSE